MKGALGQVWEFMHLYSQALILRQQNAASSNCPWWVKLDNIHIQMYRFYSMPVHHVCMYHKTHTQTHTHKITSGIIFLYMTNVYFINCHILEEYTCVLLVNHIDFVYLDFCIGSHNVPHSFQSDYSIKYYKAKHMHTHNNDPPLL